MRSRTTLFAVTLLSAVSACAEAQTSTGCWIRGDRAAVASRPSALDSTSIAISGRSVKVCYGAPKKNGRDIMGGLVPFGQPWRIGANEATTIYMPARGSIAGVTVQPGWYSLYAVPTQNEWRVFVNSAVERWGVPIDDAVRAKDIGSGVARVEAADSPQEALRLQLLARPDNAADLVLQWDRTRIRIPVTLDPR
jgi:hypothetical protein